MPAQYLTTIGNPGQLDKLLHDGFLHGRGEERVALVGRSNVGKSSLINRLLGSRVAQVSKTPGKTRAIHFYLWPEAKRVVADLPGYGFARRSGSERDSWAELIDAYIRADERLHHALILVDARHGPSELDWEAIRFISEAGIALTIVFTKVDGLKNQSERARRKREAGQALEQNGIDPTRAAWVSSTTDEGIEALRDRVSEGKAKR